MTATDELRRMLDERGVDWDYGITGVASTRFRASGGVELTFIDMRDGVTCTTILTPAQAIAATLGRRTCHVMTIGEFNGEGTEYYDVCSNCCYEFDDDPLNYCPNCGRKVVSA